MASITVARQRNEERQAEVDASSDPVPAPAVVGLDLDEIRAAGL